MPPDVFSSTFRSSFRDKIMSYLYFERNRILTAGIDRLAIKQRDRKGSDVMGFVYAGTTYHHSREQKWSNVFNLDPIFHSEMGTLLESADIVPNEPLRVENLITSLLAKCKNPADLEALLPDQLMSFWIKYFSALEDRYEITINSETVLEFKNKMQEDYELVNKRIVLNMVLK